MLWVNLRFCDPIQQIWWLKPLKTSLEGREYDLSGWVDPGEAFNAIGGLTNTTNRGNMITLEAIVGKVAGAPTSKSLLPPATPFELELS